MLKLLTTDEAKELVSDYMDKEGPATPTQEIIDSGKIPELKSFTVHPGKVSDSIYGGRGSFTDKKTGEKVEFENPPLETKEGVPLRLMVRTMRISTHDQERGEIPFKDQILATNHHYMLELTKGAIGTAQWTPKELGMNNNSVVIAAENLNLIMFENVLRMYMAKSSTSTSLYQAWKKGEETFAGHKIPKDAFPNGKLPYLMDTPSTKAEADMTVDPTYLFEKGICSRDMYNQIRNGAMMSFGMVTQLAKPKGLIFVDTKTEHGINHKGEIVSGDELYTLDSSRWWLREDYMTQLDFYLKGDEEGLVRYLKGTQPGIKEKDYLVDGKVIMVPKSMSKEFARGFSKGDEGYDDGTRVEIAVRYIETAQHLLGQGFEPDLRPRDERVVSGLENVVDKLAA